VIFILSYNHFPFLYIYKRSSFRLVFLLGWYGPKSNLCDNFWCEPPNTKFHWNLCSSFRDEMWMERQDLHSIFKL